MANSDIRIGRVSAVNYKSGMIRVTYRDKDETVTSDFPMLTNNDEYRMPQVGKHVLVAHLSNGSSRGVVIGTIWNAKNMPHETGETLYRKDFSREKDAAYERYADDIGEYLLKVANIHLNGINKVVLDGPEVEIAANISILIQSEKAVADLETLEVKSGEASELEIKPKTNIRISQEENELNSAILKAVMEFVESLEIRIGTRMHIEATEEMEIGTNGTLRLRDGEHDTTLKEIMERLEALEG